MQIGLRILVTLDTSYHLNIKSILYYYISLPARKVTKVPRLLLNRFLSDSNFYIAQNELAQLYLLLKEGWASTAFCLGYDRIYII
jgi:hypothetical protein